MRLLLATVPKFLDPKSRSLVLSCVSALLAPAPSPTSTDAAAPPAPRKSITGALIKWLDSEVEKCTKTGTVALNSKYVLLGWATTIYQSVTVALDPAQWNSLVATFATLFDSLIIDDSKLTASTKVMARRAIRKVPHSVYTPLDSADSILCP